MFDAKKLLGQFIGSQLSNLANGSGSKGGYGQKPGYAKKGKSAFDLAKAHPLKAGALASVLLGSKTGRSLAGSALKVGGMALIAGLGYQAWRNYQTGKPARDLPALPEFQPAPANSAFSEDVILTNDFALTLVRAMIAAAKADGHIDLAERGRIMERIHAVDLGPEAEAFIREELANPTDIDALVAAARSDEQKVELYTASRLTIEPDTRAERGYLDLLAGRLGLPDGLVEHIEATVASAKQQALA